MGCKLGAKARRIIKVNKFGILIEPYTEEDLRFVSSAVLHDSKVIRDETDRLFPPEDLLRSSDVISKMLEDQIESLKK